MDILRAFGLKFGVPKGEPIEETQEEKDFKTVLNVIDEHSKRQREKDLAEAKEKYEEWVRGFNILNAQFKAIWEKFGVIEANTEFWKRNECSYAQKGYFGASGYGYNFGAELEYLGEDAEKSLSIWYNKDHYFGIGDERELNVDYSDGNGVKDLAYKSLDWEYVLEKTNKSPKAMITAIDFHMLSRLNECKLYVVVIVDDYFFKKEYGLTYVKENNLAKMCENAFLVMNRDAGMGWKEDTEWIG